MTSDSQETEARQVEAAKRLGIIDADIGIIKIRVREDHSVIEVARRLGALQARFEPMLQTRKA